MLEPDAGKLARPVLRGGGSGNRASLPDPNVPRIDKNWLTEQFADCLRSHSAAWVLTDQAWMPSPLYVAQRFDAATGPFAYIRLLGDRKAVDELTSKPDHIVIDRQDQVQTAAEAIKLLAKRVPVLAFVNNHFARYASETVRQLTELGRKKK
jgi:hypothetical protein